MGRQQRTALIAGLILLVGCAGGLRPVSNTPGAPGSTAAVERFLHLAADRDYTSMGWVFGTGQGPILARDPVSEVERRMYGLAALLQHDGFVVSGGSPVPGRMGDAMQFNVVLSRSGDHLDVPFTTVRGPGDRWYVEQLSVEALTAR